MEVIKEGTSATIKPGVKLNASRQQEIKTVMEELQREGFLFIILDFAMVEAIDKQVLYYFLVFQKKFKESGGEVLIKNAVNPRVKHILEMIQLAKVIPVK